MSEQPLPTKERIRAALDVLENYVGTDGKIDATKMTQEITRLRQRVAELEKELNSPVIESEWQELQRKYKERGERMTELEAENAELKHILREIVDRVQGLQPIVLAAMQLDTTRGELDL